ncbi:GNAT family N-acetyltransferase [Streptomyces sp. NPDC090109]|uniref:GNAT family N-acetyltransferase n=1 Tax=unclassified Streptomyces TaxID=2593676 RepID=UPI000EF7D548|nr:MULTISPECIES: GNAT family N-acetyltransferase [unclassified Streptomyces]MZE53350.1 GNAT family N-acetyltransferase [Streptomyces sp. SID5770]
MTTTLRPVEPLQQLPGGGRSRTYDVCVNSRRVGSVHLSTDPDFGAASGVVQDLRIDEQDRGRGRGTVAALASEEVLRSWGCVQVRTSVPADAAPALRMVRSLGYVERSRNMVKELPAAPPALPDGVEVRPMTGAEYEEWKARSREAFARDWIERGVPEELARAKAENSHRTLLPEGLATPGAAFHVLVRDGRPAGVLWTGRTALEPGRRAAYVYDIEVDEEHRGHGYGRALMLLAERVAGEAGETLLGLHVFTDNTPAVRLYESLGYRTTYVNSAKTLL